MTHHRRGLRQLLKDDSLVDKIACDYESSGLDPKRLAMLRYAHQLTTNPGGMSKTATDTLRERGWTDTDILQICEVTAYYAYVNRIADGLGVEVEPWFEDH